MPGAVLAFSSASRSAPPCSTGSPWRTSAAELGAALRHCLGPKVRRCRPHACPSSWPCLLPEPAVVPAQGGHDGRRFMPPPAVARQRQREQGRGLLPWPEGLGSSFSCLPPGSRLLAAPSLGAVPALCGHGAAGSAAPTVMAMGGKRKKEKIFLNQ